ncbi:hypothetical protein EVAR_47786_1 [Eumeta japonica]|uniref:Uncharacterized protein n=1 Tax=Eumeta variegata TaxID=151549 RepID=A0A4C1XYE2_EUMVA|nr:hypothetical protein EVAR_47786_1 [Eumeta japonica]
MSRAKAIPEDGPFVTSPRVQYLFVPAPAPRTIGFRPQSTSYTGKRDGTAALRARVYGYGAIKDRWMRYRSVWRSRCRSLGSSYQRTFHGLDVRQ